MSPSIIKVPVLFIWGKHDIYADTGGWANTEKHQALVDSDYQELELDAGHLLMQEKTDQLVEAIIRRPKESNSSK